MLLLITCETEAMPSTWHRTKVLLQILLPFIFISIHLKISVSIFAYAMAEWKQKCVYVSMKVDNTFSYIDWQSVRLCLFENHNFRLQPANFYAANEMSHTFEFYFPLSFTLSPYLIDLWKLLHNIMKQFPVVLPVSKALYRPTKMWHTDLVHLDIGMRNCNRSINVIYL